jgi:hypothetical protein
MQVSSLNEKSGGIISNYSARISVFFARKDLIVFEQVAPSFDRDQITRGSSPPSKSTGCLVGRMRSSNSELFCSNLVRSWPLADMSEQGVRVRLGGEEARGDARELRPLIASQRIRPEVAGPMTGSAKQSSFSVPSGLLRRHSASKTRVNALMAPRNDEEKA